MLYASIPDGPLYTHRTCCERLYIIEAEKGEYKLLIIDITVLIGYRKTINNNQEICHYKQTI